MSNIFCVNKSGVSVPVYSNQNESQRIYYTGKDVFFVSTRDERLWVPSKVINI